ncbi:MAG: hypothetical protein RJA36_1977 [Pseudomonadota bacterium]
MKPIKSVRFAAAAILSALSLVAVAAPHPGDGECDMGRMHGFAHHPMGGMGPMALHRLDLSEAQHDKVFELMQGQARQHHDMMKASRKNMAELRALERAPAFDAGKARALADEQGRLMAQQIFQHAQMTAQLRALLTPEQLKRLDERGAEPPHGEHMGPGRRPHP